MLRRTSIICLEILLGIVLLVIFGTGLSLWRVSQGPVSISFLLPYADDILGNTSNPLRPEIDDLIVSWAGWNHALDVRAVGIKIIEQKTMLPVVRMGEISVSVSVDALMKGKLAPTSLQIIHPIIYLTRTTFGTLKFGIGQKAKKNEEATTDILSSMIAELSQKSSGTSNYRYLKRVSFVGTVIRVRDELNDISWGARHADINIERSANGLRSTFDLDLNFAEENLSLEGSANFNRTDKNLIGNFRFKGLNPKTLADKIPDFSQLKLLQTNLAGEVDFKSTTSGQLAYMKFHVTGDPGRFNPPNHVIPPIKFQSIKMVGDFTPNPDRIRFQKLSITADNISANLQGAIKRIKNTALITASITVPSMPVMELYNYWPVSLGQNARPWLLKHIRAGLIKNGTAKLRARINLGQEDRVGVDVDSISGAFSLNKVSVSKLNTIPSITNLSATATFNKTQLAFGINSGEVGTLRVSNGSLKLSGINNRKETLSINGTVFGPVRATLKLLSHKNLGFLSRFGLSAVGASGAHSTQFKISFPLLNSLKISDIKLTGASKLKGLTLQNVFLGRPISSGDLSLNVSNKGLSAVGSIRYANAPTRIIWKEDFTGNTKLKRRIEARLIATSAVRHVLGFQIPHLLQGPLDANILYEQPHDGKATVSTNLNLKDAKILIPGFERAKLPGQPAFAKIDAVLKDHTISSVPFFSLDSNNLSVEGKLTFSDQTSSERKIIETLVLSHFELGSTKFTGHLKRTNNRSLLISLSGTGFDATPFFEGKLGQLNIQNVPPFRLNANFQNFWVGDGAPTNNVNMYLNHDGNHWQQIEIDGQLPDGGKALSIKMIPINDGHKLSVYSADAGTLLKATDLTKSITGGSIEILGIRKGGPAAPWKGIAEMKRYNLSNAPVFARLMSLASLSGITNALKGQGIKFRLLRLPYQYQNEIVKITDALAKGSELGITASGAVNFRENMINVNGTIVPAYTLNSFIGKVPIIGPVVGPVLTGEKGGGILAAAYEAQGPLENPKIKVNPLSAFAPGFLRHFFGFGRQEKNNN